MGKAKYKSQNIYASVVNFEKGNIQACWEIFVGNKTKTNKKKKTAGALLNKKKKKDISDSHTQHAGKCV